MYIHSFIAIWRNRNIEYISSSHTHTHIALYIQIYDIQCLIFICSLLHLGMVGDHAEEYGWPSLELWKPFRYENLRGALFAPHLTLKWGALGTYRKMSLNLRDISHHIVPVLQLLFQEQGNFWGLTKFSLGMESAILLLGA